MDFILALDQGTSNTTALIVDQNGNVVASHFDPHAQHYPQEGYVEHYDFEIKASIENAIKECIKKANINKNQIAALGITNQRETLCVFDKDSKAAAPFIVWQCRRSEALCERLRKKGLEKTICEKTGLIIDPYFTATKILWLFEHNPDIKNKVAKKELRLGTMDTFIAHWFSNGELYITDVTNASRTMLMNIDSCEWDDECLKIFSLSKESLATIVDNSSIYGHTKGLSFLPDGIPICSLVGDQQASLFAQACLDESDAKATFGTGCFILLNTGEKKVTSKCGLLTSVAYKIKGKKTYCLEGSAFAAGASIDFLQKSLGLINDPREIQEIIKQTPSSDGVIFVPALCGLGSPYWQANARGLLMGLSRGSTKAHIVRAVLEGVALQNEAILSAMAKEGIKPKTIKADGGAASDYAWMQIQADITNIPFAVSAQKQQTGLGAAYLAGIALGVFKLEQVKSFSKPLKTFMPTMDQHIREQMIKKYQKAVLASFA